MTWADVPFQDLLSNVVDNRGKTCPTAEEGIPLIATNCIKNDSLFPSFEKVRFISQDTYDNWFRGHPMPEDLLFVTKGSPGRTCWVENPVTYCIAQDMLAIRADKSIILPKYLLALLRSSTVQQGIDNLHVGTLIPHFKKGDFDKLIIRINKNKEIQEFIGDLYFKMSMKIHLNQQINQTLESIAQTIFKSWFVDFDPVKAKMEGRKPEGMDAEIAALFPSILAGSEIGMIPEGWEWKPLYETAGYLNGAAFKAADFTGSGIPIVKIVELKKGLSKQTKYTENAYDTKYRIDDGDILYSWSGSPETSLEVFKWFGGPGWLNQHIFKVSPNSDQDKYYVYNLLRHLKPTLVEIAKNKQTTGLGHVTVRDMKRMMIPTPNNDVFEAYAKVVGPLFDMGSNLMLENMSLKNLRDGLLPKLISGEIQIPTEET
jgi:type I restriction enzyme, S subunit